MWTHESRGRLAEIERKTKRYPSDLTDEEWAAVSPLLPGAARTGRKRTIDLREVLNAIRYMVRSGCEWRMLTAHFPPWQTVYWWFRRFVRLFLFRTIHDVALMIDRERAGRSEPSAAILDSQPSRPQPRVAVGAMTVPRRPWAANATSRSTPKVDC